MHKINVIMSQWRNLLQNNINDIVETDLFSLNQAGTCQPYLLLDLSHFHLEAILNAMNYMFKYNFAQI